MSYQLRYGLILGGISILLSLAFYLVDPSTFVEPSALMLLVSLGITFFFMYLAAKKVKSMKTGTFPFGEAFVPAFMTFIISSIVSTIFFYCMVNYYDTSLNEQFMEMTREGIRTSIENNELLSTEMVVEELERLDAEGYGVFGEGFTLKATLTQFFINLAIFGLPFAAIVGWILKRK